MMIGPFSAAGKGMVVAYSDEVIAEAGGASRHPAESLHRTRCRHSEGWCTSGIWTDPISPVKITLLKILITRLYSKLLRLAFHADHMFHRQNKGNARPRFAELSGGFYSI